MLSHVILSGNSPGELWGWVRPLALKLRERFPKISLSLFLFPCPYATGKEVEVAKKDLAISTVFSPCESMKRILFGNGRSLDFARHPVLIHLGGDIMYASLLSRRLKARAYAYQWGKKLWDRPFAGYFVSDEGQKLALAKRGLSPDKIKVVGDLMVDAIRLDSFEPERMRTSGTASPYGDFPASGEQLVTFFPGSRNVEMTHMLPFYLRVAELTQERKANVKFSLALSPFVSVSELREAVRPKKLVLESSYGVVFDGEEGSCIKTDRGTLISVKQGSQYQLMKQSDCIVTIPGTKSGEAGFLGRPMVVVLPTNKLDVIPYPGVLDLFGKIPVAGPVFKRVAGHRILSKLGFLAQPNILAGEEIVPEIVDRLTAGQVSDALIDLLRDESRRAAISKRLNEIYRGREPGAENLIRAILERSA